LVNDDDEDGLVQKQCRLGFSLYNFINFFSDNFFSHHPVLLVHPPKTKNIDFKV